MGKYKIEIKETGLRHLKIHQKTGTKSTIEKINKLLLELEANPYKGTGKPEKLTGDFKGYWSRRINKKDRLIYTVEENIVTVFVFAALGHYSDK
jgi:toxin YoeB